MATQLDRIQALAAENRANDGLYDFQRDSAYTFEAVLCCLIGIDAISDADLDAALGIARKQLARSAQYRAWRTYVEQVHPNLHVTPDFLEELAHAAHAPIEIDPESRLGHLHIDGEHYVADLAVAS